MAWDTAEMAADGSVAGGRAAFVGGITLTAGPADIASLEIFDGDPLEPTSVMKDTLESPTPGLTVEVDYGDGVGFPQGIYVQMTGVAALAYVRFK